MAAAADGGGAWAARTASGPVRMRGDIFAAARRWRGRALPTGNLASRADRRRGAGQERLGPSYFFIPLVLGLLNSLTEGASPRKSMAPTKLRLRECTFSVVVTE